MTIPKYYLLRTRRAQLEAMVDSVIRRKPKNRELATAFMDTYRRADEETDDAVSNGTEDGHDDA